MNKGLIVTGGHVNLDVLLTALNDTYGYIIAVDHGMDALWVLNYKPDIILGDFDSCQTYARTHFNIQNVPEIKFKAEKDMTDTDLAIEHMMASGMDSAVIIGSSGTRLDHTMANMMMLFKYQGRIKLMLLDEHNCIQAAEKSMTIQNGGYSYLSLLPISDVVEGVTLKGARYPLTKVDLIRESSYAVSNEVIDDVCELTFEKGEMLVIQAKD